MKSDRTTLTEEEQVKLSEPFNYLIYIIISRYTGICIDEEVMKVKTRIRKELKRIETISMGEIEIRELKKAEDIMTSSLKFLHENISLNISGTNLATVEAKCLNLIKGKKSRQDTFTCQIHIQEYVSSYDELKKVAENIYGIHFKEKLNIFLQQVQEKNPILFRYFGHQKPLDIDILDRHIRHLRQTQFNHR